jgi:hypothetical protein
MYTSNMDEENKMGNKNICRTSQKKDKRKVYLSLKL